MSNCEELIPSMVKYIDPAKLLDLLLSEAIKDRTSDAYFERFCNGEAKIRCRTDETLYEMMPIPGCLYEPLVEKIKLMFGLPEGPRSIWQKLRITRPKRFSPGDVTSKSVRIGRLHNPINMNLTFIISEGDEQYRIELLYPGQVTGLSVFDSDIFDSDIEEVERMLERPGIVLLSSPAGQGKTTSAFNILKEFNRPDNQTVVLSRKLGYPISGIHQVITDPSEHKPYSRTLRAVRGFRPNFLFFDDVDNGLTAKEVMHYASNGAKVLVAVNAIDAYASVEYLCGLGIDGRQLARYLNGIISQRLVRQIHDECRAEYTPQPEKQEILGKGCTAYYGVGCSGCENRGYYRRKPVFQIVGHGYDSMEYVRKSLQDGKPLDSSGALSFRVLATYMARGGITTIEEVEKITP